MLLHRQNVAGPNYIAGLTPAAWFRYAQGITVTGSGVSQWDDAAGTTRFLSLPGVAANTATTPDSVPASVTGDFSLVLDLAMPDWTPASANALFAHSTSFAAGIAWALQMSTGGVPILYTSADGTTLLTHSATTSTGFSDGARAMIAVYMDVDDGAGNRVVKFYKSTDSGSTWTQIGSTVTTAGTTTIFDSTAVISIGSTANNTQPSTANIYRAQLWSGDFQSGGTKILDFNPDLDGTSGATSMTSSATGEVWTINQTSTNNPARLCKGNALAMGVDANRPINLPFTGSRYLYSPSVNGNYASTPNAAANQILGDITVDGRVRLVDYTPATDNQISSKMGGAGARGWRFHFFAGPVSGTLRFQWSEDGTNLRTVTSSVAVTATDDTTDIWVRAYLDVNGGAGGVGRVTFYTSDDGSTWTQLGTAQDDSGGSAPTSIFNANAPVEMASYAGGAGGTNLNGRLYRGRIYNSAGTLAVDFNAADGTDGAASFPSSTTGETWTVNTSGGKPAQIVGRSSILFDGAAHFLKCSAFTLNQPETVYLLFKQVSWTLDDRILDGNVSNTGLLFQSNTTPSIRLNAGTNAATNANLAVSAYGVACAVFNGASSLIQVNNTASTTGDAGAANMGGFTLGSGPLPSGWSNIQVLEAIIFPTAHDATTRARVIQYLNFVGRLGI